MTDHVDDTVEKLALLQRQHRDRATRSQRFTNRATRILGRPATIAALTVAVSAWVVGKCVARGLHHLAWEQQPFPYLELALGFIAVVVALLILSTQLHNEELAEKRSELTLQIALLTERKVAKMIALLEEQRRDHPALTPRTDDEAERMAFPTDPQDVLAKLEAARPEKA